MTSPDDRLKALFAADAPPARDPAFTTAVMADVARARLRGELMVHGTVSLIGAAVLAVLWPVVAPVIEVVARGLVPMAIAASVAVVVVVATSERGLEMLGLGS